MALSKTIKATIKSKIELGITRYKSRDASDPLVGIVGEFSLHDYDEFLALEFYRSTDSDMREFVLAEMERQTNIKNPAEHGVFAGKVFAYQVQR